MNYISEDLADVREEILGEEVAFDVWLSCITEFDRWQDIKDPQRFEELVECFREQYAGTWESEKAYIEEAIEDGLFGEVGEGILGRYIDTESLARDVLMSDMWSDRTSEGVACFYNR